MDMNIHLSYLSKSWKTNKTNKLITYRPNFLEVQDASYELIFETIMDNIMKKIYGEKYDEIKNGIIHPDAKKIINVSDQKDPSVVDLAKINVANQYSEFVKETESIISAEPTNQIDDEQLSTDPFDESNSNNESEKTHITDNESEKTHIIDMVGSNRQLKRSQSTYIGRRKLHK